MTAWADYPKRMLKIKMEEIMINELKNKWISIADKLPKPFETVLLFLYSRNEVIAGFMDKSNNSEDIAFYEPVLIDFKTERLELNGIAHWKISHWMPLPNPPKEENTKMTNELVKENIAPLKDLFKLLYENNKKIEELINSQNKVANLIFNIAETLIHLHGETFND